MSSVSMYPQMYMFLKHIAIKDILPLITLPLNSEHMFYNTNSICGRVILRQRAILVASIQIFLLYNLRHISTFRTLKVTHTTFSSFIPAGLKILGNDLQKKIKTILEFSLKKFKFYDFFSSSIFFDWVFRRFRILSLYPSRFLAISIAKNCMRITNIELSGPNSLLESARINVP